MLGFAGRSGKVERIFAGTSDRELHDAGLGRSHYHGQLDWRRIRREILQQSKNQTVREIGRQLKTLARGFLLPIVVGVVDRNLTGSGSDGDFRCVLKGRSLLHEVIADEPEVAALRKDGGFLRSRTVFEAVDQTA